MLDQRAIHAAPINYPTAPHGTEQLRLRTTPCHTDAIIEALVTALCAVLPGQVRLAAE